MHSKLSALVTTIFILCLASLTACQKPAPDASQKKSETEPKSISVVPDIIKGPALLPGQEDVKIIRVTPSGDDVTTSRQIVFQFNRPIVPIGRMDRTSEETPVTISPPLACEWRWLNTSALSCNLGNKTQITPATHYTLAMDPGITAEDGATLSQTFIHKFTSQRPQVRYARFKTWRGPGSPVLRVTFNQPVSKTSVETSLSFTLKGEPETTFKIKAKRDPDYRETPRYIRVPGEEYELDFGQSQRQQSNDDLQNIPDGEARRNWLVSSDTIMPLDSNINLNVTSGLVSADGPEHGIEDRVVVNFNTFPEFKFLGVSCVTNAQTNILITSENADAIGKCNPQRNVSLSFSTPVQNSQVRDNVTLTPGLAGGREDYDPWENVRDNSRLRYAHSDDAIYKVWLPEQLKPFKSYKALSNDSLEDIFGRKLETVFDVDFNTDHRVPNYQIAHQTAVLESEVDSDAVLYVTNLDQASYDFTRLTPNGANQKQSGNITDNNDIEDIQYPVAAKLRDKLESSSGALYGHVSSEPFVDKRRSERSLFAIITPYQLHVKLGHFNTTIWVTDLKSGEPVEGASVKIYKDKISSLTDEPKVLGKTVTDSSGLATLEGTKALDPKLILSNWCSGQRDNCDRLFIRVDKDGDMGLMPLDHRFEINTYRVSNRAIRSSTQHKYGHIHTWGTTAQGVYRAGGTIQYKIYVRDQDNERYIPAPRDGYSLSILDPTGKSAHDVKDIKLSEFGGYSGEFTVPKTAPVGWYQFKLSSNLIEKSDWRPMRVLVSDFTPSPFKVSNELNADLFVTDDTVKIDSAANLHSGGAYTDAEIRVTATLRQTGFRPKHPLATGFYFDTYTRTPTNQLFQKNTQIGDDGKTKHSFKIPPQSIIHGRISVESAVRDDRGKYIASSSAADFIGVTRLVGLKQKKWVYQQGEKEAFEYLVVDKHGNPAAGTAVDITVEYEQVKSAKVKGAGNAYITNYTRQWIGSGTCKTKSKAEPSLCHFTPELPGSYRMTARIKDTKGKSHSTTSYAWVVGKGRVVWEQPNDNSLQIIPEQTEFKIGDRARYLIKNPFPGTKALVTLERYGVLKSWVQTLEGSTPLIDFEIEKDFMPGVYLSVTVMSPRVDAPLPKFGEVDLGKPSFKTGYVSIPVIDPYKQMDVEVSIEEEVYKPRDIVNVKLSAAPRIKDQSEKIEIAVAVLDEAVLDLIQGGETYFDPYKGFNSLDGLDLRNFSLLTQLVGRQKIEKKGANAGGDGGADLSLRTLFKFVSYWNPSIIPDENGEANISIEVPDNLTGWRVLAFAVTPTDRMGLGHSNFKVNRPTEIRPLMPNQVTEGDSFVAGFSVMNRTDKTRNINVELTASGSLETDGQLKTCRPAVSLSPTTCSHQKTVKLGPYKRETIYMPLRTATLPHNRSVTSGTIRFNARASDALDGDGVVHNLSVGKRRSLDTAANYASLTDADGTENLAFPSAIHPDVGDVSITLSPSVIGNVEGAFRHMKDYSYSGWESKLSRAVMADHYQNLIAYMPEDFTWDTSETLIQSALSEASNYQAPNGGMAYFRPDDAYVSPYLSAYTALAFNWLRASGHEVPAPVEQKLHDYLDRMLKKDVLPTFYSRGMSSTVRAVALAALAPHDKVSAADLQRYRKDVQYMDLMGKAHYLQAALGIEGPQDIITETADMILASSSQSGGKFSFNETYDDSYARILATPLRANCSILSSFITYAKTKTGKPAVGDIPFKLTRMITQARGNRDHWPNTQENVFCMNALVDYAKIYEAVDPNLSASVLIDDDLVGSSEFTAVTDAPVTHSRQITADDVGVSRKVTVSKTGDGRLYYATHMRYAPLDIGAKRQNAGMDIRKEYNVERNNKWVLLDNPSEIKQGELVRVDIFLSLPTARHFVVVDDPIPGGLEPVNRDLATSSNVDADKGAFKVAGGSWYFQFDDWRSYNVSRYSFYHQELRHDAARFYSDYLPAGNYVLSYSAQAIAQGEFVKMPVLSQELYDSDIYGKGLPGTLAVAAPRKK